MNDGDDSDEVRLQRLLAEQLRPLAVPREAQGAMDLAERVRRSAEGQQGLSTQRREDGIWQEAAPGAWRRRLREDAALPVELWRLAAGTRLDWPAASRARELLVLEGDVDCGGPLPRYGYRIGDAGPLQVGAAGALVYVRHRLCDAVALDAAEQRWWSRAPEAALVADEAAPVLRLARGVKAVLLHGSGGVVAMLVRVLGGASVPDHGHGLEEDCYVLEGDLYLSDILLREGDYQLARAGTRHTDCLSDAGAVFYFRGALPAPA
ncbi:cupin domain-containing protein [Pelomonas sp. KK5]|uniref:cupin domain-containing protein n=1 Tax=Pelomonas sp. KK5 TaxID=1855730 RepID=UPI00097C1194|nr:cupin domain-containing protein [Pelomonas sp. KK5]